MRGYLPFLRKELVETARTWRLGVLPLVLLLFAVTGPLTARFSRELLASISGGVPLPVEIPDPVWRDTLPQWVKNLGQLGLLAVVIVFGGLVSGERRQGSDIVVLTKPVSRTAYVLAKLTAALTLLAAATLLGALVEHGLTWALFGQAHAYPLAQVTGAWLVQAILVLTVVLLASATLDSAPAASGLSLALVIATSLLGMWGPAARWTPAGLGPVVIDLAAGRPDVAWGWPVATTLVASALLVVLAVAVFHRREL